MKLCRACQGKGVINHDICESCGGEGLDSTTTFTVGKIIRRRQTEFEEVKAQEKKKQKIDKKNATRGGF